MYGRVAGHMERWTERSYCKVVIPRGTGRSYGIRWRSEMQVTDETKGDGRTDGRTELIAQV